MSLQDKLGQLVMVGFDGTTPSREVKRLIATTRVGGVILFRRNIDDPPQVWALTRALQRLAPKAPLFIAVDQEGGRVSRLPPPFTQFPPAAVLGKRNSFDLTYGVGEAMGREMAAVGINMDMAPVLDVNTNAANPVIGDRAFGDSPIVVEEHGLAMIVGLQDRRVIACAKHFPGHGATSADSHLELPEVAVSLRQLERIHLRPFEHAIANRLAAVMTAHVRYPALDPAAPATLSKKTLTGLLRRAMGFEGIVITDDLEMKAISSRYDPPAAALKAFLAGADILLFCRDTEAARQAIEALTEAVRRGRLSEARIDLSLERILRTKERFLLGLKPPSRAALHNVIGCEAHLGLVQRILSS
ncbi:MAG: beta-N-acetylhexosaminidase [Nitrospirae bacterium]|nr:beta-N-acetylhexosaminidase [Nitrospirota bacterium]